jgi:small subunit ribosomal protein S5
MESAGIKDVLTKSLGSSNALNVVKATMAGLAQLRDPKAVSARRRASVSRQSSAATAEV